MFKFNRHENIDDYAEVRKLSNPKHDWYGHAIRLELSDWIYWYEEHYGFVQHPKCNNGCGGDNTIEVIAWREIEPFESEVKE